MHGYYVYMGTWGTQIFDDDIALDVRGAFRELLAKNKDITTIEQAIEKEFIIDGDTDGNDTVLLALCCAELETGTLTETTSSKTLEVIESGRNYEFWRHETSLPDANARKQELDQIKLYIDAYDGIAVERTEWKHLDESLPSAHSHKQKNSAITLISRLFYALGTVCLIVLAAYVLYMTIG